MTDLSKLAATRCAECDRLTAERDAALAHAERLAGALRELVGEELGGDRRIPSMKDETDFYRPCVSWATRRHARAALASWQERAA